MRANLRDSLTRGILRETPRRVLLRALSSIGLASLSSALTAHRDAAARKRKRKKKKCKGGTKKCGKQCFDLQSDAGNCGRCGNRCEAGEVCVDGVCTCPAGQADCGDGCIDIQNDAANCGICGIECASGICVHGACVCTTDDECPEGCSSCITRAQGSKACLAGFDNSAVCESDDDCPIGSFCAIEFAPRCSIPCGICPIGETACDETCSNLLTDGANCGACGNACDTGACVHGACTCENVDDCPAGCSCNERKQGGHACSNAFEDELCDTDEECPIGSVCGAFIDLCTKPCLG